VLAAVVTPGVVGAAAVSAGGAGAGVVASVGAAVAAAAAAAAGGVVAGVRTAAAAAAGSSAGLGVVLDMVVRVMLEGKWYLLDGCLEWRGCCEGVEKGRGERVYPLTLNSKGGKR